MTRRRRPLPIVAGGLLVAGLVACGDATDVTEPTGGTVANVGQLPELQTGRGPDGRPAPAAGAPPAVTAADTAPSETTAPTDTTADPTVPGSTSPATSEPADETTATTAIPSTTSDTVAPIEGAIGEDAAGNRILALGDSITAAIGPQYGGQLCDALEAQGWYLGVDAFQGRAADAGLSVVRRDIVVDDWDAAIVNLGSNYRGDPAAYTADLRQILARLGSMPIVLVTVSEFDEEIAEVNFVIRDLAAGRDNVRVVEWSELTRDDDSLTGADGLHLSEAGRAGLAEVLAEAIGEAPSPAVTEPGCELLRDAEADAPTRGGDGTDAVSGDGGADAGGG